MSNITRRIFLSSHSKSLARLTSWIMVGWAVVLFCLFATLFVVGAFVNWQNSISRDPLANLHSLGGDDLSQNQLLVLKIQGVIVGDDSSPEAASTEASVSGYDIKQDLYAAADDQKIKGVLLEINSPGGTIYGSRAIADGVKYYREHANHPVFAHVEGTAASGAYWAATSTNKIIADYGSDVGSIGVIMGPFEYYDTVLSEGTSAGMIVTQNGIQSINITAGTSKDLGNPFRKLTAQEQATLQQEVNNDYAQFVSYVSAQRGISADTIRNQLGAMTYDNQTAITDKLIDSSGSREDALDQLATESGIRVRDYQIVGLDSAGSAATGLLGSLTHATTQPKAISIGCPLSRSPLAFSGDVMQLCGN